VAREEHKSPGAATEQPTKQPPSTGTCLLGIDYGSVRIGLAVSDPDRKIAFPLATYSRRNREMDTGYFREVVAEHGVGELILGLPLHLSGRAGQKATEVRSFARWLKEATGLPVLFWDERFTTVEAEKALLSAGLTNKRRKARRDRVAAQILLQSYLDAGCPGEQQTGPLDG
jgi:putative holliday junction resolvase